MREEEEYEGVELAEEEDEGRMKDEEMEVVLSETLNRTAVVKEGSLTDD